MESRVSANRVIYLAHAFSDEPVGNVARVRSLAREIALRGDVPLAPQLLLPQFLDEATEREIALQACLRLVLLADEVHVYGEPTEGMRREIAEARRWGIPVVRVPG